jgi:hypothetical protein
MIKNRAFAYPCNNTSVQGIDYSLMLKEKKIEKYARTGSDRASIIHDFDSLDPLKVPRWHVEEGTTLTELIAFAKEVKETEKWAFTFFMESEARSLKYPLRYIGNFCSI